MGHRDDDCRPSHIYALRSMTCPRLGEVKKQSDMATNETSEFGLSHYSWSPAHKLPSPRVTLCGTNSSRTLLDCVPEEEFLMDVLAHDTHSMDQGLLPGSYHGLLALYSLTPLTTFITFLFLALLPSLAYPLETDQWKEHYPPYLPFPLPELLISIAFSSLSHVLRAPIFSLASLLQSVRILEETGYASYSTAFLSCAVHTVSALFLRVCTFAILLPSVSKSSIISTRNPAFRTVWWTALGWSIAEAAIGIAQGYQAIGLYRDILVPFGRNSMARCHSPLRDNNISGSCQRSGNGKGKQVASPSDDMPMLRHEPNACGTFFKDQAAPCQVLSSTDLENQEERRPLLRKRSDLSVISSLSFASLSVYPSIAWDSPAEEGGPGSEESELQIQVDRDIDHLLTFRRREEIEELYGVPFIKIPVFVSCLHRVNALLQSLGFSLLLAAGYFFTRPVRDDLATTAPHIIFFGSDGLSSHPIRILTISVFVIHLCLTLLHAPILLPKLGVPIVVYVSFITALGTLFVGLAMWGGVS
ncbi:hypothetical protein APHAL10511_007563 [Amanita phalloides]|nr:hypothetical protein APHAL10511_007563 [Amanita phalloides]